MPKKMEQMSNEEFLSMLADERKEQKAPPTKKKEKAGGLRGVFQKRKAIEKELFGN